MNSNTTNASEMGKKRKDFFLSFFFIIFVSLFSLVRNLYGHFVAPGFQFSRESSHYCHSTRPNRLKITAQLSNVIERYRYIMYGIIVCFEHQFIILLRHFP